MVKLFHEFLGIAAHDKAGEIFKVPWKAEKPYVGPKHSRVITQALLRLTRIEGRWAEK